MPDQSSFQILEEDVKNYENLQQSQLLKDQVE